MIDTHVNLHHHAYEADLEDVLVRANKGGIHGMLSICDRIENFDKIRSIVENRDNFWMSVGAHPHEAKDHLALTSAELCELAQHKKVIGIGETGLDFHYNLSPKKEQIKVFQEHIKSSQISKLPLIVHTRLADIETAQLLEDAMRENEFPLLMHCYTSGVELLKKSLDLGAYVSISGIATFRNATDVRDNIQYIPQDKLLVETDCPYLAPIPKRGQRNEPEFINHLVDYLSEFLGKQRNDLVKTLDDNFFALFKRAANVAI